ncbi:hypothetical protein B0H14DRAFT_3889803 [Mycena olivaceomarginata]|nr:hypothetical protein B0H14DRAFT_3889803 [Mycena olivaceomarginata]
MFTVGSGSHCLLASPIFSLEHTSNAAGAHPSAPSQGDLQHLTNFSSGAAHDQTSAELHITFAGILFQARVGWRSGRLRTKLEDREDLELVEEIRLSPVEPRPQSSPPESKGRVPPPPAAPVGNAASSMRRSLPHERKTSYGVQNESVRFYSQTLSRLSVRPDAAGGFGDDGGQVEAASREGGEEELEGPGSRRHRNGLAPDIIELVITETTALALSPAPSNIDTTSSADEAVTQKPRASDSQVNAGVIRARSIIDMSRGLYRVASRGLACSRGFALKPEKH